MENFDASIVLLSMLQPVEQASSSSHQDRSMIYPHERQWHSFIDHLCWLCDYDIAGKTVTSIAVEQTPEGLRFWLASNNPKGSLGFKHLKWILERLNAAAESIETEDDVLDEIFTRSVEFSCRRVRNYSESLHDLASSYKSLRHDGSSGKS
jgi:hypothetical protein